MPNQSLVELLTGYAAAPFEYFGFGKKPPPRVGDAAVRSPAGFGFEDPEARASAPREMPTAPISDMGGFGGDVFPRDAHLRDVPPQALLGTPLGPVAVGAVGARMVKEGIDTTNRWLSATHQLPGAKPQDQLVLPVEDRGTEDYQINPNRVEDHDLLAPLGLASMGNPVSALGRESLRAGAKVGRPPERLVAPEYKGERPVSAATKYDDEMFVSPVHGMEEDAALAKLGAERFNKAKVVMGFVTDKGRFVTRQEAAALVKASDPEAKPYGMGLDSGQMMYADGRPLPADAATQEIKTRLFMGHRPMTPEQAVQDLRKDAVASQKRHRLTGDEFAGERAQSLSEAANRLEALHRSGAKFSPTPERAEGLPTDVPGRPSERAWDYGGPRDSSASVSLSKNQYSNANEAGLFTYGLYRDGKLIGEARGHVGDETAYIGWIGSDGKVATNSIGVPGVRALREAFREDFPNVKTFEGSRVSGARSGSATRDEASAVQSVTLLSDAGKRSSLPGMIGNASEFDVASSGGRTLPPHISRGMDPTLDERMARAKEQGFDTDTVLYHGSARSEPFDSFDLSKKHAGQGDNAFGRGVYTAPNEGTARFYARHGSDGGTGHVRELLSRHEKAFVWDERDPNLIQKVKDVFPGFREHGDIGVLGRQEAAWTAALKRNGYDAVQHLDRHGKTSDFVVLDPAKVRGANAEFDAAHRGSASLLLADQQRSSLPGMIQGAVENASRSEKVAPATEGGIVVYKAAPDKIDRFDMGKAKGGVQGKGLYFADTPEVSGPGGIYERAARTTKDEPAHSYTARLSVQPDDLLRLDKPLSEQSAGIKAKLDQITDTLSSQAHRTHPSSQTFAGKPFDSNDPLQFAAMRLNAKKGDRQSAAQSLEAQAAEAGSRRDRNFYAEAARAIAKGGEARLDAFGPSTLARDIVYGNEDLLKSAGIPGAFYESPYRKGSETIKNHDYIIFDDSITKMDSPGRSDRSSGAANASVSLKRPKGFGGPIPE